MPGTTRYSATFDRTYEEDDRVDPPQPANARRSRSQSWQANSGLDGRPYTPLGGRPPNQRSSSTDSGPSKIPDHIPTRTVANTAVKAHNNPFQFVKVGTCPLYKKAEEQLKKTKEVKKQDVLKEEEEEWQTNLDSWKSRRRKMSEDVFRRQEEIKQFELEEQISQVSQKKTKTFSEMVESRAHRGRTLSLCLLSSPLEFQDWEYENKNHKNGSCSTFTDESEENSTVNSEDEGVSLRGRPGRPSHHDNQNNHRTNGDAHIEQNGSKLVTHNGDYNKLADLTTNSVQMKPKEGSYIDSGLESISSSHRAGDTPDSCSDFSQDSNSSIDCDSPRTGINILEEFSSKSLQMSPGQEVTIKLNLLDKTQGLGFTFQGGKDAGQVLITSVLKGSKAESSGIQLGDQIITVDGSDVSSKKHTEITSILQKGQEKGKINILLWRHSKTANGFKSNEKHVDENTAKPNKTESQNAKSDSQYHEKSIESENEMYVDDFEELQRQSELLTSSNKSETTNMSSQAHSKGNISPSSLSSYKDSIKTSSAPKLKENNTNGAIDEKNKSEKNDLELNPENQKKNIVKVKRVRKKGVYALDVSGAPNQIPQEGIPVNFLYPLSPVTELPSPAEETKTVSSAFSSNPTNSVSNSQNGIFLKETLKEAEVKLNSSTIKENNKTTATAPKSVASKTTIPSDESRPSDKAESKFDSTNVSSSPIFQKNKNISLESSHEETPKVPSSPKKMKVKVKKTNTSSDQKSDSPQVAKEIPSNSVTQTADLSVQTLTAEGQQKKEQASSSLTNDKQVKANKNENVECCQKKESNILSTESSTVTPITKSSLKDNTSASVASISIDKTKNLSLKIDTKTDSMNLPSPSIANTKQPKTPVDEKSKSPLAPKKEKIKLKENNISSAEVAVVISDVKYKSPKDEATDSNEETLSDVGKNLPVKIDAQSQSVNLATTRPVANTKQPKTPVDEKSKPPFAQKKEKAKPKGKIIEHVASDSPQVTKEPSNSSVSCTSPITNVVKEGLSKKEVNTTSLTEDKRTKSMMNKSDNSEYSPKREKDTGIITIIPEAKSTSSKAKATVASSASTDKTKNLSLKIETQNESVNLATTSPVVNSKQPKTPQDEKSKPSFAQKKEKIKSKEFSVLPVEAVISIQETKSSCSKEKTSVYNATLPDKTRNLSLNIDAQNQSVNLATTAPITIAKPPKTPQNDKLKSPFAEKKEKKSKAKTLEQISCDTSQVAKDTFTITVSCSSPTISSVKENLPTKEQKFLPDDKTIKISNMNECTESSEIRENGVPPAETTAFIQEKTSTNSKSNTATSSNKARNLSLNFDVQNQSMNVTTSPPVINAKSPKTPQDEKLKAPFVRKRERSKSKGKATEQTASDPSQVVKEASTCSLPHTLPTKSLTTKSEPQKEQKSGSIINDRPINESAKSSQTRENNILLSGSATVIPEVKSTALKEKPLVSDTTLSDKSKNLSLKIDAQSESITFDTSLPISNNKESKTPQDEKTKPRLARKRSKSKGKATEQVSSGPSIVDKESPNDSMSHISATKTLASESESHKEQKSGSVVNDKPVKVVTENAKSSQTRESNVISSGTPTVIQEINATGSKEKSMVSDTASSYKTKNLSLKIAAQNESVTLSTLSPVTNVKQPKTPQDEKAKPHLARKRSKSKGKAAVQMSSSLSQVDQELSNSSVLHISTAKTLTSKSESHKGKKSTSVVNDIPVKALNEITESSETRENSASSAGTVTVIPELKSTASKDKISVTNPTSVADKIRNLTLKIDVQDQSVNIAATPPVANVMQPKTPGDEKSNPPFAQKKENTKSKEKANLSLATSAVCANIEKIEPQKSPSATISSCNVNDISSQISNERKECLVTSETSTAKSDLIQSSANCQDDKLKPSTLKRTRSRTKKKNTNSQKVNSPAKQNEELSNSNFDSLNIVFQSEPKNLMSETQFINVKHSENNSNRKAVTDLVPDIPPVEKVAEEMEKLILEQLEEEERAKELASELQSKSAVGSPEHLLIAPPKLAEPPKEKPPPPPSTNEGSQKDSSLKRVNSTKRIKKEIHKRRSNFLGIDNADESNVCGEPSIPPPPALEEILKAEMELDRQNRLKIESAATERLTMEEKEIMQKEKEIIESLESEERRKQLLNGTEDFKNVACAAPSDVVFEEDRILSLKNERKRIETERFLTEEQQQLHLLEEKQLREREEFIRKQEAGKSAEPHSDPSLSVTANAPNNSKPVFSSLTETKSKVSLSDTNGDGKNVTSKSSAEISENKSSECDEKDKVPEKPAVPPKPLKKKEAIRKERERLRQEQEALQREREEHRRKLVLEQEELMKHQKSHAPDAPVSRLGPLPPLVPPNFPPQLTTTMNATPNARESASFPSRSHHGAPNGAVGSSNAVELMGPPIVRQNRTPASRKAVQNEAWGQQKMPSVRKQNHDSLTESRYNQNHWLIQEAEMRRITELKERQQRATQLPCSQTHLAEDDVCSTPPRVPVIPPPHNPHLNYAVQDKMWNYGQSNMPPKKYPSPAIKDPLHTVYPRETVSQQPPTKPSRVVPMERQEQMLSVSGRKRCSHCNEELGRGAAMIIESLQLYYHIHCFQCCVCQAQLGNGSCGTDVRVRNNKLHCHNCYSNDEAGLKFSQV